MKNLNSELALILIFTVLFAVAGVASFIFGLVVAMPYIIIAGVVLGFVGFIANELIIANK